MNPKHHVEQMNACRRDFDNAWPQLWTRIKQIDPNPTAELYYHFCWAAFIAGNESARATSLTPAGKEGDMKKNWSATKSYLGDGVWASLVGATITLMAEDGFGKTNTILLKSEVFAALITWEKQIHEVQINSRSPQSCFGDPPGTCQTGGIGQAGTIPQCPTSDTLAPDNAQGV